MLKNAVASIIIPSFNTLPHTRKCLESLRRWTDIPHDTIVVDNGSTDGSLGFLEKEKDITLIKSTTNLGFAGACNLGIEATAARYVVLANSDLIFTPHWITNLIFASSLNRRIGLIGPVTNKASGFHVEVAKKYNDDDEMLENASIIRQKNIGFLVEVPFLIFFCVLIHRPVIDKIGLLDDSFGLGGCDDLDYSFRANQAGFCCAIDRSTFIHHACSKTYSSNKMDYNRLLIEAREKFKKKWGPEFPMFQIPTNGHP